MSKKSQPIVVQLTPPGRAAVATLLVEGTGAVELVDAVFRAPGGRPLSSCSSDRPVFGHFESDTGEEVVVRRRGDLSVELHCHGGHAAVAMLERALVGRGCRAVAWQDWTADRYGDPIVAAAHVALAEARTERTAAILLDQYRGALRRALDEVENSLRRHDEANARKQIHRLLSRADLGRHLTEPWKVVLTGRANVGKSSLINALIGYRRAIVQALPGTTRDVVTACTAMDGWPVELADTAGASAAAEELERAGFQLAQEKLRRADLVVLVFDASMPWSADDHALLHAWPDGLIVHNKGDLPRASACQPGLVTSAMTGQGIDALIEAIAERLVPNPPGPGEPVPFTPEQIQHIEHLANGFY